MENTVYVMAVNRVGEESGFRFMAVRFPVFPLDGKMFETVDAAKLAAHDAVRGEAQ